MYDQQVDDTTSRAPIYYGQASVALVGDASYSAFTGPIQGSRYRFEVTPTAGTLNFTTLLADYRKYLFLRPITFAFRGLHYGRYGKSADDSTTLYPLFLGEEQLMRGYSVGSFSQSECGTTSGITSCPAFDRLLGSKLAVASFEIRIPVFGVPEYGLLNVPFLPMTLAPFVDAGVAWTRKHAAELLVERRHEPELPHARREHRPLGPVQRAGVRHPRVLHRASIPAPGQGMGVGVPVGAGMVI